MFEFDLSRASEDDEDMRCRLCSSLLRPFTLLGSPGSSDVAGDGGENGSAAAISSAEACTMASIETRALSPGSMLFMARDGYGRYVSSVAVMAV